MPSFPATFAEDVINQPARTQFEAFLDEQRSQLNRCLCLDGLTEEQARLLVPSRTTLLGCTSTYFANSPSTAGTQAS
jgi:hypothetical protein